MCETHLPARPGYTFRDELAAAWLPVLTCQEIAEEIENNLNFLTSTQRDLPDKHRSLRAAFDYSWNLLEDEPRQVFCCLSIFRGGFDRKSAQQDPDRRPVDPV